MKISLFQALELSGANEKGTGRASFPSLASSLAPTIRGHRTLDEFSFRVRLYQIPKKLESSVYNLSWLVLLWTTRQKKYVSSQAMFSANEK